MPSKQVLISTITAYFILSGPFSYGAGMDHATMRHEMTAAESARARPGSLIPLREIPPSGRAREAGSDGRYTMESTSAGNPLSVRCAQASRGLVMLDNATWKRCGGKPRGASMGAGRRDGGSHHHMQH